uniref:Uncharacterized protein n=1 Tax=Arundo donax TaxID=35708 RepID=A0A0A9HQ25_ARUDO
MKEPHMRSTRTSFTYSNLPLDPSGNRALNGLYLASLA